MSSRILLKRSDVANDQPAITDLQRGELAINTADLKLYCLSPDGTHVEQVAGVGFDHHFLSNLTDGDDHTQYLSLFPYTPQRNIIQSVSDAPEIIVRRMRGQTAPMTVWQNDSGVVLASINYDGTIWGSGKNIYNLNASNIAFGTIDTICLGSGFADATTFLRGDSTWQSLPPQAPAGANTQVQFNNVGVVGGDAGLAYIVGTATLIVANIAGSGTGIINLNASKLTTGIVPTPRLGTGTADNTTFLRGDNTWTSPPPAPVTSVSGRTGAIVLAVGDISGAAPLASPALTGTPTAPTPAASDNSILLATTAFVKAQGYLTAAPVTSVATKTGAVTLVVGDVSGAAPLASPILIGTPTAPTALVGTNTTQLATTAFVTAAVVPAGLTTQVQFNNAGVFAGAANLTIGSAGQLNFNSIPTPSSPVNGDLWEDNTRKCRLIYSGGMVQSLQRTIYRQIIPATTLTNPTTSTSLLANNTAWPVNGTLSIPPAFWVVGRDLSIACWPTINMGANGTLVFKLLLGATAIFTLTTGSITNGTVNAYMGIIVSCRVLGASGSLFVGGTFNAGSGNQVITSNTVTIDLTTVNILDFKVNFGTSNVSNTIILNGFTTGSLA